MYDSLDDGSVNIVTHLFGEPKINMAPMKKQHESSDCKLFATASAVHLSKKCSPAEVDKRTRFPTC